MVENQLVQAHADFDLLAKPSPLEFNEQQALWRCLLPSRIQDYLKTGEAILETGNFSLVMDSATGITRGVSSLGGVGQALVIDNCLQTVTLASNAKEYGRTVTRSAELFHIYGITPEDVTSFLKSADNNVKSIQNTITIFRRMIMMPDEYLPAADKGTLCTQTRSLASDYMREPRVLSEWIDLLADYTATTSPPAENTVFWNQTANDVMQYVTTTKGFVHPKTLSLLNRLPPAVWTNQQKRLPVFLEKAKIPLISEKGQFDAYISFLERLPTGDLSLAQAVWTHTLDLQKREMDEDYSSYSQQLDHARITAVRLEDSLSDAEKAQAITSDHLIACILNEAGRIPKDRKWTENKAAGISRGLFMRADDRTMWETYEKTPNFHDYTNTLMTLLLASRPDFLMKVPSLTGTDHQSPVWVQLLRDGDLPEQQRNFFLDIIVPRFYPEDKNPLINTILDAGQEDWLEAAGIAQDNVYLVAERTKRWKMIFENVKSYIAGLADDLIAKKITKADALIAGLNNLTPERHGLPPLPDYDQWERTILLRVLTSEKVLNKAKQTIAESPILVEYFSQSGKKSSFNSDECHAILSKLAGRGYIEVVEFAYRQRTKIEDHPEYILTALANGYLIHQENALIDLMLLSPANLEKRIDQTTLERMVTTALFNWLVAIAIKLPSDMSPDTFHQTLLDIKMHAAPRVFYKLQELSQWRNRLLTAVDEAQHPQLNRKRLEQIFLAADIPIPASFPPAATVFPSSETPPPAAG